MKVSLLVSVQAKNELGEDLAIHKLKSFLRQYREEIKKSELISSVFLTLIDQESKPQAESKNNS